MRIASLHRYPVKSLLGEQVDEVALSARGLLGDRAYALVDVADGTVASAGHPRRWGALLGMSAAFVDEPVAGAAVGREVRLTSEVPTAAASRSSGPRSRAWRPRRSSRARRRRTRAGSRSARWTRATISMLTMRCAMTTLARGDLPEDRDTLRGIARSHRRDIPGLGTWACAGVYADVPVGAAVRVGDPVTVSWTHGSPGRPAGAPVVPALRRSGACRGWQPSSCPRGACGLSWPWGAPSS